MRLESRKEALVIAHCLHPQVGQGQIADEQEHHSSTADHSASSCSGLQRTVQSSAGGTSRRQGGKRKEYLGSHAITRIWRDEDNLGCSA